MLAKSAWFCRIFAKCWQNLCSPVTFFWWLFLGLCSQATALSESVRAPVFRGISWKKNHLWTQMLCYCLCNRHPYSHALLLSGIGSKSMSESLYRLWLVISENDSDLSVRHFKLKVSNFERKLSQPFITFGAWHNSHQNLTINKQHMCAYFTIYTLVNITIHTYSVYKSIWTV